MSDEPEKPDNAEDKFATPFARMAARITHNAAEGFAGAFVIMPPTGDPIEVLILEPAANEAVIWGQIKARIEMKLADLDDAQRRSQAGWGMGQR
jgi:hypothetical protein